jgi:hypothetical protein
VGSILVQDHNVCGLELLVPEDQASLQTSLPNDSPAGVPLSQPAQESVSSATPLPTPGRKIYVHTSSSSALPLGTALDSLFPSWSAKMTNLGQSQISLQ